MASWWPSDETPIRKILAFAAIAYYSIKCLPSHLALHPHVFNLVLVDKIIGSDITDVEFPTLVPNLFDSMKLGHSWTINWANETGPQPMDRSILCLIQPYWLIVPCFLTGMCSKVDSGIHQRLEITVTNVGN